MIIVLSSLNIKNIYCHFYNISIIDKFDWLKPELTEILSYCTKHVRDWRQDIALLVALMCLTLMSFF